MKYSNAKNWMEECCTMGQFEIQKTYKRDWNDERRNEFDKLIIGHPKNVIDYHDLVEYAPKNEDEFKSKVRELRSGNLDYNSVDNMHIIVVFGFFKSFSDLHSDIQIEVLEHARNNVYSIEMLKTLDMEYPITKD
jgi:hypothetical protein